MVKIDKGEKSSRCSKIIGTPRNAVRTTKLIKHSAIIPNKQSLNSTHKKKNTVNNRATQSTLFKITKNEANSLNTVETDEVEI